MVYIAHKFQREQFVLQQNTSKIQTYIMSHDSQPHFDSNRNKSLNDFLRVLNELAANEFATDGREWRHDIERTSQDLEYYQEKLVLNGIEAFGGFQQRVETLDKELQNFDSGARQLGGSAALLLAACRLRDRLVRVLFIFRENTATLFPRRVSRQSRETLVYPNIMDRRGKVYNDRLKFQDGCITESIPREFEGFAQDLRMLLRSLNDFPEFRDEASNIAIHAFVGDLEYWASCLAEYKGQFRLTSVQRYVHELITEIGNHIDVVASTLSLFAEIGIPTIQLSQEYATSNFSNLAIFCIILSIVTATLLHLPFRQTDTALSTTVNALWFSSLVFSISATAGGLLSMAWTRSIHRSPNHRVPWWLLTLIRQFPLILLVKAVACLSLGLMLVAYTIRDNMVISILTTVFTSITSLGLGVSLCWVTLERLVFINRLGQHRGHLWLGDVMLDIMKPITGIKVSAPIQSSAHRLYSNVRSILSYIWRYSTGGGNAQSPSTLCRVSTAPPTTQGNTISMSSEGMPASSIAVKASDKTDEDRRACVRDRFKIAVRTVILLQSHTRRLGSPLPILELPRPTSRTYSPSGNVARRSIIPAVSQRLRTLECSQYIIPHQALVRDLQFSPDGKHLATASLDNTASIFNVAEPAADHHILYLERGFTEQIVWSSCGSYVLTRSPHSIKIFTKDGICLKTFHRTNTIRFLQWVPHEDMSVLSVEGHEIVKLDKNGEVIDAYNFGRVQLQCIAVTSDGGRIIGIRPVDAAPNGLHPRHPTRVKRHIVVYNTWTRLCENQTPIFQDANDVKLTRNDSHLLILFGDQTPPQLWTMALVGSPRTPYGCLRLTFHHVFSSTMSGGYVGSTFGGKDDQFILCASEFGDILIWDRDTAALLHRIRPTYPAQELTCIACNQLTDDPFSIASGGRDGSIRIWTTFSSPPPRTPPSNGHDTTSETSELSTPSYFPRGWHADRIPADQFLTVPSQRRRSMVPTATLPR
ncbi:WD40 repeat-like protein [Rhizopogon salebrosus TDB-379]|nr:WD40 repeat-like protein [Rhizopogon salebrosus TDB-379]